MDQKTGTPSPSAPKISERNKELLKKEGASIAELQAAGSTPPAEVHGVEESQDAQTSPESSVEPDAAKKKKTSEESTLSHQFKNDDERSEFIQQLVRSKQYFVSIKQKNTAKAWP